MTKNLNEITITEEESRTCLIDNKKFESNRKMIWHVRKTYQLNFEQYILKVYYNNVKPVCLKTGKPLSFKAHKLGPWFSNYGQNCFPRKPHTDETKQKIKEGCEKTSMEKFGVSNVFSTKWCQDKIKETILKKYGVDNIMKTNQMRELFSTFVKSNETIKQTKETNQKIYGKVTYTSTDENKLRLRKYNYNIHYNNDWNKYISQLEMLHMKCFGDENDIFNLNKLRFKCNMCNFEWNDTLLIPFCSECEKNFEHCRSKEESILAKWVKTILPMDNVITNKRITNIDGKVYEADIFIPTKNLIIELNGLFWHSERCGKGRNYHIDKLNSFESMGYKVIQIFEDEWLFKTDIIKRKLFHILGCDTAEKIYARKCKIEKIDNTTSNEFLNKTHIQGKVNSSYCYGAYYSNELIAIMSFSPPRISMGNKTIKENEYEMVRFSTSDKYRVIGIAGKLLNYFIEEAHPKLIYSYADRRWTKKDGNNVYEKIGFKLVKETNPNYWYVKKYNREYRFNYTKKKLVNMGCDPTKTEWEIMKSLGYDRIWDCGHLKYELTLS